MRTGSITLCLCLAAVFATAAEESKVAALTAADDARDRAKLPDLVKGQDFLFNLAGQTSHMDSMKDPETDLARST